jgi:riboflavin synthase
VFTGIVEGTAEVLEVHPLGPRGAGMRIALRPPGADRPWARPGESVSVAGVCLTVVGGAEGGADPGRLDFDLSAETLSRTWLGALRPGRRVNVERALRLGERLGGHLVSGHVDGGGTLVAVEELGDGGRLMRFEVDPGLERWLIEKGSVTLDGVSLTVVEPRGRRFDVAVIPTTLALTTLGESEPGRRVHVEADLVGKWIEKLLPERP